MTQQPSGAGTGPETAYLEQLLRTDKTAWELFRYGYEAGLARSIDHDHLARIIRAQELNYGVTKTIVKSTADFIDIQAHREKRQRENLRRNSE